MDPRSAFLVAALYVKTGRLSAAHHWLSANSAHGGGAIHHTAISLIFNELCGRNSQWQLRSKHREILYSTLIREMAETGVEPKPSTPQARRRTHLADNLPEKDETELEPFAEATAFAPALLTASESVNYTRRYQRPRPPVFFQTSRSWRLLLSRYARLTRRPWNGEGRPARGRPSRKP